MISGAEYTLRRAFAALAAALLLAGCAALRVDSDYDHHATFANYHRFAWLPRERFGTHNPLVVQHAREAILARLTAKGFTYVAEGQGPAADFIVDFTIGMKERLDVESYPLPYSGPWYPGYSGVWWGNSYWGSGLSVRNYRQGALSIDVFDARTHRPVWHGRARKFLSQADIDRSEAPIRQAVQSVLAGFPPQ